MAEDMLKSQIDGVPTARSNSAEPKIKQKISTKNVGVVGKQNL
jgi:hypothetical protein